MRRDEESRSSGSCETTDLGRRAVVVGVAAAGLGLATHTLAQTGEQRPVRSILQGKAPVDHPPVETISASYAIRGNLFNNTLTLRQSSVQISGDYDDGTAIEGTIAGLRPRPVTVTFVRTLNSRLATPDEVGAACPITPEPDQGPPFWWGGAGRTGGGAAVSGAG